MFRGVMLVAVAVVALYAGFGRTGAPSAATAGCDRPSIENFSATVTSPTTAIVTADIVSTEGGTWAIDIYSPDGPKTSGSFGAGGTSINVPIAGLPSNTHIRGMLRVYSGCGDTDALIDIRMPNEPRCTSAPAIQASVGSVDLSGAVLTYAVSSPVPSTAHAVIGSIDVPASFPANGGTTQVTLSGLSPGLSYTVTVTASNTCGTSSQQVSFTTLRATDCSGPPSITSFQVTAVRPRSAVIGYAVASDGIGTVEVTVRGTRVDVVRALAAPGASGTVVPRLGPGKRYLVTVAVDNACGHVSASRTITTPKK